jgi:translation initiation factor IF-2
LEDIDDVVDALNAREERKIARQGSQDLQSSRSGKVRVGSVEFFFDKIGVAAIALEGALKVGDIIEIGTEDDAIRQRVSSMQIDRRDVLEASAGDSVGIKLKYPVRKGSEVCRIG